MPELFSQKLRANFTPEQQDYYLLLVNELKELLNGQTQEEVLASGDPEIIQQILKIKQEMLNFVLTKKTREMTRQEEKAKLEQEKRSISLDEIERKQKAGEELTDNELKFLYRIDGLGLSFSSSNEDKKRVEDIINQRNIKEDVSYVLGCSEDQVSLTTQEFLAGTDIVYHFGFLDLERITSTKGLQLPQSIGGGLNLSRLTSAEGLQLPQSIGGGLYLGSLTSAEGLQLPQSIDGGLYLGSLTSAEGLQLPQSIGGDLDLERITSAKGLQLPQSIGGSLYLMNLRSAEGLEIPLGVKSIYFEKMSDYEIEKLKKKFPHIKVNKI